MIQSFASSQGATVIHCSRPMTVGDVCIKAHNKSSKSCAKMLKHGKESGNTMETSCTHHVAGKMYGWLNVQGVKYNIPVAIWLPEKYPRQPPIMYVVPTHDMVIKPRHSFVTPSGVVNSEYLKKWTFRWGVYITVHSCIHGTETLVVTALAIILWASVLSQLWP